jgi:hypothetical protein
MEKDTGRDAVYEALRRVVITELNSYEDDDEAWGMAIALLATGLADLLISAPVREGDSLDAMVGRVLAGVRASVAMSKARKL